MRPAEPNGGARALRPTPPGDARAMSTRAVPLPELLLEARALPDEGGDIARRVRGRRSAMRRACAGGGAGDALRADTSATVRERARDAEPGELRDGVCEHRVQDEVLEAREEPGEPIGERGRLAELVGLHARVWPRVWGEGRLLYAAVAGLSRQSHCRRSASDRRAESFVKFRLHFVYITGGDRSRQRGATDSGRGSPTKGDADSGGVFFTEDEPRRDGRGEIG